ncbi:ABC transporter permease subunit [uncultured Helicobacter sp.]|uniref:ABC transporter permease subunit n=1 Tax=uncultured Helicobacter sp. TaxID=175537 RepID=UPI001C3B965E|nr:ABC transporter permease subunit [Candidatus Helicobacter avicola]
MISYIIKRLASLIPILLIASFAIFAFLRLGGTDPVAQFLLNSHIPQTPQLIAELREEFGLDKPLLEQYFLWLGAVFSGDFGTSYMSGRSVGADFFYYLPNTLLLVLFGFLLTLALSIPLGIISAIYEGKWLDKALQILCLIGVSVPNFWLALLLIAIFCVSLQWLPAVSDGSLSSFILPTISIALMSICINARLIRANMLQARTQYHILYAKLRNLPRYKIITKHILYNALIPIVTAFGMHIGELIGGCLLIESIFALPGIGLYSIQAIAHHDYPIIQCFVLVLCGIFTLCNLFTDILYAFLDPRISKNLKGVQ